jgi:hypothetical protein
MLRRRALLRYPPESVIPFPLPFPATFLADRDFPQRDQGIPKRRLPLPPVNSPLFRTQTDVYVLSGRRYTIERGELSGRYLSERIEVER